MNKWNAIGFLMVNTILLAFFALSADSVPMQIFAWSFAGLNFTVALAGAIKR